MQNLKKQQITKIAIHFGDENKNILDKLKAIELTESVDLDAEQNNNQKEIYFWI